MVFLLIGYGISSAVRTEKDRELSAEITAQYALDDEQYYFQALSEAFEKAQLSPLLKEASTEANTRVLTLEELRCGMRYNDSEDKSLYTFFIEAVVQMERNRLRGDPVIEWEENFIVNSNKTFTLEEVVSEFESQTRTNIEKLAQKIVCGIKYPTQ